MAPYTFLKSDSSARCPWINSFQKSTNSGVVIDFGLQQSCNWLKTVSLKLGDESAIWISLLQWFCSKTVCFAIHEMHVCHFMICTNKLSIRETKSIFAICESVLKLVTCTSRCNFELTGSWFFHYTTTCPQNNALQKQ